MMIWKSTNQLLYDHRREAELMEILRIQNMDEVSIIPWRPPATPPQEASYIFVKYYEPVFNDISFDFFSYENGVYSYPRGDGSWFDLHIAQVLGWAYPISYRK